MPGSIRFRKSNWYDFKHRIIPSPIFDRTEPDIAGTFSKTGGTLSMRPNKPIDPKLCITSQVMGDPKPGRSALDKRNMR